MSYCCNWEVLWQFCTLFLHEVLEQSFTSCIVGEWEVEFLLGEGFDKLLIHFPRLICRSNNGNSIFFFENFLLILGKNFSQFSEVRSSCTTSTFLFLLLALKDLLYLIHINNGWREGFGNIEGHSQHLIELFLIIDLGFQSQGRQLQY